jgi:hypothetical protein
MSYGVDTEEIENNSSNVENDNNADKTLQNNDGEHAEDDVPPADKENKNRKSKKQEQEQGKDQGNDNKNNFFGANEEFMNFSKDEQFKDFKDIFKTSKISKGKFNAYVEKIMENSSSKRLFEEMEKQYGKNYQEKLQSFQSDTEHIFTEEEKNKINQLPAEFKIMLVKAVDTIAKQRDSIAKKYGIDAGTKVLPSKTSADYTKDFNEVTRKLMRNEYRTAEEFESLKRQRIELATRLGGIKN